MKTAVRGFLLLVVFTLGACFTQRETGSRQPPPAQQSFEQEPSTDFQIFYDDLSPYGTWVEYPRYGYVWMPDQVEPGFSPYATAGRWIFTDDGWTWVSDYSWGWAPFHYGRWDYDNVYGWFWVPDREWGPAWVSWRSAPGYYGWAPLRPGISISVALGRDYRERDERWVFVRDVDMMYPDIGRRHLDRSNTVVIINNSTVIVNTRKDSRRNATYIAGPDRDEIQRVTRTRIDPVVIRENDRPGHHLSGSELQIYRPRIEARSRTEHGPVPQKLKKLDEVRPASERNGRERQREQAAPPAVTPGQRDQQPTAKPTVKTPPDDRNGDKKEPPRSSDPGTRRRRDAQPQAPASANPPADKGKEKPPQKVSPPKRTRTQPPAPKTEEGEKERENGESDAGSTR